MLIKKLEQELMGSVRYDCPLMLNRILRRAVAMELDYSKVDAGKWSFFARGKRLRSTPGKWLARHAEVEDTALAVRLEAATVTPDITHLSGDAIMHVFNPSIKTGSCMGKHTFDNLPMHPCEMYTAPPWSAVVITTPSGGHARRLLFDGKIAGNIYATDNVARLLITRWSEGKDHWDTTGRWQVSATMAEEYICPYMDMIEGIDIEQDDGQYYYTAGETYNCQHQQGHMVLATSCGCNTSPGDVVTHAGNTYCPECFNHDFILCAWCHDYEPRQDSYIDQTGDHVCYHCAMDGQMCDDCGALSAIPADWPTDTMCPDCHDATEEAA